MKVRNSSYDKELPPPNSGKTGILLSFVPLVVLGIIFSVLSGCGSNMSDYFLDNTEQAKVTGVTGEASSFYMMENGTILIPPGETTLRLTLDNPRNFTVQQEISNSIGAAGTVTARQTDPGWIEVEITGAKEGEKYILTLTMRSPDGLRDFAPYTMRIECMSFLAALRDFTVNDTHPPLIEGAFTADACHSPVTLKAAAMEEDAFITIYEGANASGAVLKEGGDTVETDPVSLEEGANYFYIKVTNGDKEQSYSVTINRGPNEAVITAFNITSPVTAEGVINEAEKTITVTVPYKTVVINMTTAITTAYTGASVSPAPGLGVDFTNPQTYTVTAKADYQQQYTVTVIVQPGITVSGITSQGELAVITFDEPASIVPGTPIDIILSGDAEVDSWYIELSGPETSIFEENPFTIPLNTAPGFYTVNVIAEIGGIPYSGSFSLTVE